VAALAKLGVKPRNTVMVGDRIDSDIIEANRVGMKSVLFKWNTRYDELITSEEEKPKFTIGSLTELPGLLGLM
jgi:FMN phosphatase YigB (HAD superfamily)